MNPVSRGIRNAFRNNGRTASIVLILGLSIGLSLTMLVAQKAVDNKIKSVKSAIGNTIDIMPAGFNPGSQANNALTTDTLASVKTVAHVSSLTETLDDRLSTTGSEQPTFSFGRGDNNGSTTSLTSPVKINISSDGTGANKGYRVFIDGGGSLPTNFTPPISFLGTTNPGEVNGSSIAIKSGKSISGGADTNDALVSTDMASKNSLSVGSTFTAYSTTLTVAGIFDSGSQGNNNTVIVSLPALQRLSGQAGDITSAVATVDSLDNLSAATTAIKNKLGSDADVTSAQDQADNTVKPLNSVKTVTTFSLIGAVAAGAVIILLVMVMVVRERKREIGVIKAIGGSNLRIMSEFMVESLTLAVLGAVIGLFIGVIGGQPVTNALVSNSQDSANAQIQAPGGGNVPIMRPDGAIRTRSFGGQFGNRLRRSGAVQGLSNIHTQIGWGILLDGFGAAVVIAVLGSALSAGMISKVRPSTVMRTE